MNAFGYAICAVLSGTHLVSCAPREVPAHLPASSPLSRSAAEARPVEVARALREEPPLPGESAAQGWSGLASPAEPTADPHAHHRHAGHAAPTPDQGAHDHAAHSAHAQDATEDKPPGKVVYTCPMHPDVVSDREGQCPRCGMKLVPKK